MILALSGGTGGSKMVDGLAQVVGQPALTAVVNTGDDGDFYGLRVCPDLDICTYVLAGVVSERGWGYADDTFRCLEGLATYGEESWFGLGDRDLATHIHRTLRLAEGAPLSEVTAEICAHLGVEARLLPMTDDPVRTRITTPAGTRTFQEYLVKHGAAEEIERDRVRRHRRRPPRRPGLLEAIAAAERIVICPSSPVVSIGTILGDPGRARRARRPPRGLRRRQPDHRRRARSRARPTASSPAPATPSARRPRWPASTPTSPAVFVLDARDAAEADAIAALGVRPVLTDALMPDRAARARLAATALEALA